MRNLPNPTLPDLFCPHCRRPGDEQSLYRTDRPLPILDPVSGLVGLSWTEQHICPDCGCVWLVHEASL